MLASDTIDAAIREVVKARQLVPKVKGNQVRGGDILETLKATAMAWFNTHRPVITGVGFKIDLTAIDQVYQTILTATARSAAKKTYVDALKDAKTQLVLIRAAVLVASTVPIAGVTDDLAPDFSPLAGNQEMQDILKRRWRECCICVKANAHLAAIVMMGGLLEALFVARANKLINKAPLINATSAPKDKIGSVLNYQDWMLDSYIKVGCELNWITNSAKDVADVLKGYRNYIHPEKERRHGIVLSLNDSSIFWSVVKELTRQLLMSAST